MAPSGEIVSFESFRRLVAAEASHERDVIMDAEVRPALRRHLETLRAAGRLAPIPGAEGHRTGLIRAWEPFLRDVPLPANEREAHWREIFRAIEPGGIDAFVDSAAVGLEDASDPEEELRTWYGRMLAGLGRGEIRYLWSHEQPCAVDGVTYRTAWSGWSPTLGTRGEAGEFVPMRAFDRPAHRRFEVDFPSGEVLVSDWIAIPAFTRLVDAAGGRGLGSEAGRETLAERYAREFGFVSVHTGGTGYGLYEIEGCLVAARPDPNDPDPPGWRGSIEGAYRGVTMIDRAVLVGLLARTLGEAAACSEVEAYLAGEGADTLRLSLAPGVRHLYFGGDTAAFAEGFRPAEIDLDGYEAGLVLAPAPLTFDAAPGLGR